MKAEMPDCLPNEIDPSSADSPRLRKVEKLSRVCRLICRILLAVIILSALFQLISPLIRMTSISPHLAVYPGYLVNHGILIAGIWIMERVFNSFVERGVFHPGGARWLKWLGGLFIGVGLFHLFGGLYVLTNQESPMVTVANLLGTVDSMIIGVFVLMLGWVLEEACELRKQQEFTI